MRGLALSRPAAPVAVPAPAARAAGGTPRGSELRARAAGYVGTASGALLRAHSAPLRLGGHLSASLAAQQQQQHGPAALGEPALPEQPVSAPAGSGARFGRARALSETGRQLLLGVFADEVDALRLGATGPSGAPSPSLGASGAPGAATAAAAARSRQSKGKSRKAAAPSRGNYFAMMNDGEEEEEEDAAALRKASASVAGAAPRLVLAAGQQQRIDESVVGESEQELSQWSTVSSGSRKKKDTAKKTQPAGAARGSAAAAAVAAAAAAASPKSPPLAAANGYESDDGLFDLQEATFGGSFGRQVGAGTKAMQHKAVEKRGYAMEKRDKQRAAQR
jgi:hypothetical protein